MMLTILMVEEPVFFSVKLWAGLVVITFWEEKVRLNGEMFAAGPPVVPVPVRMTDCGLPVELSATEIAAVRCPAAVGLNKALIVQFEPAATEMPQLLVWEKSAAFAPVIVILEINRAALPVLNNVTPPSGLMVPTTVLGNVMVLVLKLTEGAVPTPVREAVWGLPVALSTTERVP
jgi:hypothetical protein